MRVAADISATHAQAGLRATYQRYLNAWSAIDAADRFFLLKETLSPAAIYSDLIHDAVGYEGIALHLAKFQVQNPRHRFQVGRLDREKNIGRAEWVIRDHCGIPVMPGCDIIEIGEDGLILSISGFPGAPPLGPD